MPEHDDIISQIEENPGAGDCKISKDYTFSPFKCTLSLSHFFSLILFSSKPSSTRQYPVPVHPFFSLEE